MSPKVFNVIKGGQSDGALDINDYLIQNPSSTFFMKMEGDGPEGSDIKAEDVLVVDRSITPKKGSLVVVSVEGELVIQVHSPDIDQGEEVTFWGVVSGLLRRLS